VLSWCRGSAEEVIVQVIKKVQRNKYKGPKSKSKGAEVLSRH